MIGKIKNKIESELSAYLKGLGNSYNLKNISPLLYKRIKIFASSPGKRIRPILFVLGYLGFAAKEKPGLYKSAISIELLHDFMLIHDDIIDKSNTRRGSPSMHAALNKYLKKFTNLKFTGEDLGIVAGDVVYAMALDAFLSIKENPLRKEKALKRLIEAALYTGSGEFIELLYGINPIDKIKRADIDKIYDLKTANYTFSYPLTIGATLAGAQKKQIKLLFEYGRYLGRAFQIKDDIIGIFSDEKNIGKPNLTDLQESKKTILIWQAYKNASRSDKKKIKNILNKENVSKSDLLEARRIIKETGSLSFAKNQINKLTRKARLILKSCSMKKSYKGCLEEFSGKILDL